MSLPVAESASLLLQEQRRGVVTLTLNRPRRYNALSDALIDEISSRTRFLVDATYNGKALAWLRESASRLTGPVVYWHTGGALGVIDRMSARNMSQTQHVRKDSNQWLPASDTNFGIIAHCLEEPSKSDQKVVKTDFARLEAGSRTW